MQYQDFKIRIASVTRDTYRIIVESPMGSAEADLELPFQLSDLEGVLQGVSSTVRGAAVRDLEPAAKPGVESTRGTGEFGVGLYRAVFRDTVQSMLDQCLGSLQHLPDSGLRIRLEMDLRSGRMSDVASLPWELMRREIHDVPLSVSKRTTLVRSFDVMKPANPIPFKPPLRVLVIVSNPGGTASLDLADEEKRIRATWGRLEDVQVTFVKPTVDAMLEVCASSDFHVIHYMGHGDFDPVTGQGILLLEKPDGSPDPLGSERLKALFQDESDTLRLVFLNACKTAVSSERKGLDPFAGIATMLIDVGVPAVVAMQFPISDTAAITFSDTFYRRIVAGYPVDAAVAEGRKALWVEGNQHAEWATPVLFMRSRDGVLFTHTHVTVEPIAAAEPERMRTPEPSPVPAGVGVGGGGTPPPTRRNVWIAVGGGALVLAAAAVVVPRMIGPPAEPLPVVTEARIREAPDSVYVAGEGLARVRIVADNRIYDDVAIAGLPAGAVLIHPRTSTPDLITPVYDTLNGVITAHGILPGQATLWAVAGLAGGDSIIMEPVEFPVLIPPEGVLAAINALDEVEDLEAGQMSDDDAVTAYETVRTEHQAALQTAGRLEEVSARIAALRTLIALRDSADAAAVRADLTLAEKLRADSAYLTLAADARRGAGDDRTRIATRSAATAKTIADGGKVARFIVCTAGGGTHCADRPSAETLRVGATARVTVYYVGRETFTLRWFRDGQEVDSARGTPDSLNPNGYRVTLQQDVDTAGLWEVRVFNAAGNFVARQAFQVE